MRLRNLEIIAYRLTDCVQVIHWAHEVQVGMQFLKWQKSCVVKVDLAYPKELRQWHNDYISPDKIEIKGEMLSKNELMIAEFIQYSYW